MAHTPAPTSSAPPVAPLTPQQRAYFDLFGFLALPGLFRAEVDRLVAGFEAVFADEGVPRVATAEHLHLSEQRVIIPGFVDRSPDLAWLLEDPRLLAVVGGLMPSGFEYAESDGNLFYCESTWHPDNYAAPLEHYHVKCSFYLDPIDADSGAIRMIPGSNHFESPYARGLRRTLRDHEKVPERLGIDHREVPSVALASEPGDLIVWNFRTIHASFHGGHRRRLFSINFREPGDVAIDAPVIGAPRG